MALTILIAALAVCGLFLIVWAMTDALFLRLPNDSCHIFFLCGDDAQVEQQLRSCLWFRKQRGLRGKMIFVDCGISAQAQITAQLMLKNDDTTHICAFQQINDYIRWEKETIGTGAD